MKQKFFKLFALIILIGSVAFGWFWMDFKGFMNNSATLPLSGIDFEVTDGATYQSISQQLYDKGVISSYLYTRFAGKIYPELTRLKRGEYHLDHSMTPYQIFLKLASGKVKIYQIRFIEGWTFNDFLTNLAKARTLQQDVASFKYQQIAEKLSIAQANPEGWFYPDTYNYQKGASDMQILQVAHTKMKQTLARYWAERDLGLPYETPYEVLIMASIIEKETGMAGERDRIAGVFIRRLNKNMRLQTDPTVIYGLGKAFDGNLRKKHLLAKSEYNTYRNKGLPPTPIAMPSEASLSAAVHPADGTELYFVARGDGSHQFSSTLEQHNQAVRYYQLNIRQ